MHNLPVELLYKLLEYASELSRTCRHLNMLSKELCLVSIAGPKSPTVQSFNLDGKGLYERVENDEFEKYLAALASDKQLARTVEQLRYRDLDTPNGKMLQHCTALPNLRCLVIQSTNLEWAGEMGEMRRLQTLHIKSIVAAEHVPLSSILEKCPSLCTLSIDMVFYKHYTQDYLAQLENVPVNGHAISTVVLRHKLCGRCCCAANHDAFDLVAVYTPQKIAQSVDGSDVRGLKRLTDRAHVVATLAKVYGWSSDEHVVERELASCL